MSRNGANSELDAERKVLRAQLADAINEEDDPLAVYDRFVQWTVKNYGERNPASGLLELLEEATRQFKDDPVYKTDLRYLKLWTLYATQGDRAGAIDIYAHLLAKEIGTSFSLLYEGYAALLEADGKHSDADVIFRHGIKRGARPLERLKNRYQAFQVRAKLPKPQSLATNTTAGPSKSTHCPKGPNPQARSAPSSSLTAVKKAPASRLTTFSTRESRYAAMLAPPDPGKRPEKMRFNMSLLWTTEGGEFSLQEARARSMGLLGKKWAPPPETSMPVNFNDDGMKGGARRKSFFGGGAEPTVTINTKEALADVFGMYNSPDRTIRTAPGSKYAPLREVMPITPGFTPLPKVTQVDENAKMTPFRPFVDENAHSSRTPSVKFTPFFDENQNAPSGRTPSVKFTPFVDENKAAFTTPRPALSVKDSSAPSHTDENPPRHILGLPKSRSENATSENGFSSKVFTPAQTKSPLAPLRDVFTDDHGKPTPKARPVHERAKSHHDVLSPGPNDLARAFTPLVDEDAKTPFKVFSRPPEEGRITFASKLPDVAITPFIDPKPAFTPFKDPAPTPAPPAPAAFTPFVDAQPDQPPSSSGRRRSGGKVVVEIEDSFDEGELDQYQEDSQYDDDDEEEEEHEQYEAPLATEPVAEYEEGDSYQEIPLGGRFGRFNVMTPITERTYEFTTNSRGAETPSGRGLGYIPEDRTPGYDNVFIPQQRDEHRAAIAAERLAAELKEVDEEGEEYDAEQPLEPFRLSVHHLPPQISPPVAVTEEKTGGLSLGESLTLGSKFRPPNPCNPFDASITRTLLLRIPSDPHFYDRRDEDSNRLDDLQKFAKKARKGSSADISACFPLELDGHRFSVSEKLGEGGFGAVFKARDLGARTDTEDSEEELEDDDEESISMVALKVVRPRNLWEYHVLRRLHSALPASLRGSVVLPHALYAFRDESFLILDLCPQGTLLSIVNNSAAAGVSQQGGCLDELLVVFFTTELLRFVEATHEAGFIHGDLKIDNCLLRLEDVPGGGSAWTSVYQSSGEGGWSYKGLKVIDFGRTVDTRLFPSGQQFIAEWPTDDRDCFEAREDRPWTFQTDYFGLVGIIYCMLFGKYIQGSSVVQVSDRYKVSTPLKRYWQTDLWNRLFDILLNPCLVRPDGQLPVSEELGAVREEMEAWLQANCNRTSNTLKGLLKKVEVSCYVN
ncbi:hypothetical protein DXG03_008616 [Asterophora parasitica]|uniref:Uncharacterized protein n=1 Tax=Asterophora parasitica TaxID=117018 RepID=A0A9P7G904_9AGAR|nr:hypothetical protein DXG03_008616 [Asterophora parasitica]